MHVVGGQLAKLLVILRASRFPGFRSPAILFCFRVHQSRLSACACCRVHGSSHGALTSTARCECMHAQSLGAVGHGYAVVTSRVVSIQGPCSSSSKAWACTGQARMCTPKSLIRSLHKTLSSSPMHFMRAPFRISDQAPLGPG